MDEKYKISKVQMLWIIGALNLFLAGAYILNVPDSALLEKARYLGISMFLAGAINLSICIKNEGKFHGSRWLLADGLATTLLSLFPLFNKMILPIMIPFFFSAWELFSGIVKVIDSKELFEDKIHGWQYIFLIGGIELLSGVGAMIEPLDEMVGINHVIASIFLVQSIGFITKATVYKNLTIK